MAEQKFPEVTVGALIFNNEGKIFLMKSHKWHGKYVVPGGHVELGERIEATLKREVKEETGLDIYDIKFLGVQELVFDNVFWKKKHFVFLDFACKTNGKEVKLDSEGQEYAWVSLKDAFKLPVEPYTRKTIESYIEKNKKK